MKCAMASQTVLSSLADRLARGDSLVSAWCGLQDPAIAGLLAKEGFDAVTLDMQHGPITLAESPTAHREAETAKAHRG